MVHYMFTITVYHMVYHGGLPEAIPWETLEVFPEEGLQSFPQGILWETSWGLSGHSTGRSRETLREHLTAPLHSAGVCFTLI